MRVVSALLFFVLCSVLAAPPSVAQVASPLPSPLPSPERKASPVQIDRCQLEYGGGGLGLVGALSKSTGALQIKFTNESNDEAAVIRFAVDVDGKEASVRDVGKFAPGVTVDHKFKDYAGTQSWIFSRQPQPRCHVTYVKFTNGQAWEAPEPAVTPAQATPSPTPTPNP